MFQASVSSTFHNWRAMKVKNRGLGKSKERRARRERNNKKGGKRVHLSHMPGPVSPLCFLMTRIKIRAKRRALDRHSNNIARPPPLLGLNFVLQVEPDNFVDSIFGFALANFNVLEFCSAMTCTHPNYEVKVGNAGRRYLFRKGFINRVVLITVVPHSSSGWPLFILLFPALGLHKIVVFYRAVWILTMHGWLGLAT